MPLGDGVKLISFSLFGCSNKYLYGMEANAKLAKLFYPEWQVIVYHDNSVPIKNCKALEKLGAELINVTSCGLLAPMWRFLVADEHCERFIVRDSDSRIDGREALAVKQWEQEHTALHVMRDHPHHVFDIMGGMWGGTTNLNNICFGGQSIRQAMSDFAGRRFKNYEAVDRSTWWMIDQQFLAGMIYNVIKKPSQITVHAANDAGKRESFAKVFPSERCNDKRFVGEIFNVDDQLKSFRDWQYNVI